ncbi:MAG TPA: hypothetical protein VF744_20155 [Beijerinckiaceae bacterium]|jgi:hypothetical protein
MSGVSSRRLRLACLAAVSALAIGVSGIGFPPVRNVDLDLGVHGRLHIDAVRTDASLLGTAVAQVPGLQENLNRALQGVGGGGAETVTLDDVRLDLGFAVYRMPKVEVAGSSLSRADLMGLFDKDAGDLAGRLARLSAKQVRVPELVVEQTLAGQRQVTRYRNIAIDSVTQGRVAAVSSEGASFESKGGPGAGTGTMGRMTLTDLDLPEIARVYSERAPSPPGPLKKVYGGFTLDDLTIATEDGPQVKVARIAGKDFSARPTKDSWTETMKAFATAEALDKATPAEQARVFGAVADVFDSMEVGLVEATGIDIAEPKGKDKAAGRIARIAYAGGAGKPADVRMERFEIVADKGRAKIDLIAFTGFSFASTFRGLRDLGGKPPTDLDMATLRQLIPTIGTIRMSGIDFDVPDDKKGPAAENIKFSLKDMEVTADQPINGIPTNMRLGLDRFRMPIPPGTTEEGLKDIAALGYTELDMSWVTAAAWNAPTNELLVREVSVRGAGMGATNLRATLGGVTRDVFSTDNAMALVALMGATVKNADLTIENGGLFEKLLDQEAKKQRKSVDALRTEFGMAAAVAVPAMLGGSGQAKAIGQAVARFVAKPGKLSLSAKTKDPAGLGLADFALGEPGAILDKLEVTATAE